MDEKNKQRTKKGLLALAITGAVVGVGFGVKAATTKVKKSREKRYENERLKELENEQFED